MTTGEIANVVATLAGSVIGALGAALAVYLTLRGQHAEDRERIQGAVVREVIEFARVVIGHLDVCETIRGRVVKIPVSKLPQALQMPVPIIYPAVADKIGLLKSPQHVVAFYMRTAEVVTMTRAIADAPNLQTAFLQENNIGLIVEALLDICQFAAWIIRDQDVAKEEVRGFDRAVAASILSDMDNAVAQARERFRIKQPT